MLSTIYIYCYRNVPLLEENSFIRPHQTVSKSISSFSKNVDSLKKFLDALFDSRIMEARKYYPPVMQALGERMITDMFVPELVSRLRVHGSFLSSDQYEVLVRCINSAMVDEKMAMLILPLTAVIYQV